MDDPAGELQRNFLASVLWEVAAVAEANCFFLWQEQYFSFQFLMLKLNPEL